MATPRKGKMFAKTVTNPKTGRKVKVSYGQAGKAKDGGKRIRPGTSKGRYHCVLHGNRCYRRRDGGTDRSVSCGVNHLRHVQGCGQTDATQQYTAYQKDRRSKRGF